MTEKWALVTGACVNTGAAIVEKFAREGVNVIFTGRSEDRVTRAEENYKSKFSNVKIIGKTLNALNENGEVDEKSAVDLFLWLDNSGITITDLVLNAADLGVGFNVFESPLKDFQKVINVNVVWNFCLIQNAAKRMVKNGGGSITFINSNTAYRAIPERAAYSSSKGGQLGLMRALALDLGKYKIRVNAVLPGMIHTDRTDKNPEFYKKVPSAFSPLGTIAEGADIADAVWYFVAHANVYGGLKALKALSAPFPQVKFIPTGGIDLTNLKEFLQSDKIFAVGGSFMMKGDITENCKKACEILNEVEL